MAEAARHPVVVIGLGNPLMGDDGTGLAALALLTREWELDPVIECVDGGTWGMNLLPVIEAADRLLLLDAIHAGEPPGAIVEVERYALPRYLAMKISPHQVDLRDVLALAELRGTLPEDTMALGIQPERVEMITALSPMVQRALPGLVARAVHRLRAWGYAAAPRTPVHA